MSEKYVFHGTIRGASHINKNTVCEDFSGEYRDEQQQYYIIAIADGHGALSCFRSEKGSEFAVEAAISVMKDFADEILVNENGFEQFFKEDVYQKNKMRELTTNVCYQWEEKVSAHYHENCPTKEQLEQFGYSMDDEDFLHIYGTTLIAALWLPECLIMIHQGDGRCEVIYNDGTVDQPVPWDERCVEERTTSLCNSDVIMSFRHYVINFEEKVPIACYVCSDGVEDSYRDTYENMGGVHTFFKDLTCQILEHTDDFQPILEEILNEVSQIGRFSELGSGDDVSVAGIVDINGAQTLKENFLIDVNKYKLEEALFWKKEELRSKTRKHGILLKRMDTAKVKVDSIIEEMENLKSQKEDMLLCYKDLEEQAKQEESELEQYKTQNLIRNNIDKNWRDGFKIAQKALIETFNKHKKDLEIAYKQDIERCEEIKKQIKNMQQVYQNLEEDLQLAEEAYNEAKSNFEEYDEIYQAINEEILQLENEIASLLQKNEK